MKTNQKLNKNVRFYQPFALLLKFSYLKKSDCAPHQQVTDQNDDTLRPCWNNIDNVNYKTGS